MLFNTKKTKPLVRIISIVLMLAMLLIVAIFEKYEYTNKAHLWISNLINSSSVCFTQDNCVNFPKNSIPSLDYIKGSTVKNQLFFIEKDLYKDNHNLDSVILDIFNLDTYQSILVEWSALYDQKTSFIKNLSQLNGVTLGTYRGINYYVSQNYFYIPEKKLKIFIPEDNFENIFDELFL